MKLYGHPLSSCTRKALMVAAEKDATIDLVPIDLLTGEHKQPEYLARHPFGVVPVLDDDGFQLFESRAIIRYLDARLIGVSLIPTALRDRARMDQWLSVDQSYIAPHTRTLAVQRILREHQGLPVDLAATAAAEQALATAFAVIDRALATSRFLGGDSFSLADVSLAPYIAGLAMLDAAHVIADRGHLARWSADVFARASWQQATAA